MAEKLKDIKETASDAVEIIRELGSPDVQESLENIRELAKILEAANGGVTNTKIMYKAFLSYAQLKEYLTVLIENGLLEYIEGSRSTRRQTRATAS